MKTTRELTMG